jgi:hypothetical protein
MVVLKHCTRRLSKCTKHMGHQPKTWRKDLGEVMEGTFVTGVVICLICVDLASTTVNVLLEETDLLNPKYHHQGHHVAHLTHTICVTIISIFVVEQLLHIVAFGGHFFSHFWMVADLVVVLVSFVVETMLEGQNTIHGMAIALRLWKTVAFIFDIFLVHHEHTEYIEKKLTKDLSEHALKKKNDDAGTE